MGTRTLALFIGASLMSGSGCTGDWYLNITGGCPRSTGCEDPGDEPIPPAPPPDDASFPIPMGLPEMSSPEDNPLNLYKVELGKQLFSDPRLAADGTVSCESCHLEHLGWADGRRFSFKVGGSVNARHTPTLFNVGYEHEWYWDGRAPLLEDQIVATMKGQMATTTAKLDEVARLPEYRGQIARAFGRAAWDYAIPMAIAAYLRTLRSGDSRWDRFMAGDMTALNAQEQAGWKVFTGKAQCNFCHTPPLFANGAFHDLGLERGKLRPDAGRGGITKEPRDMYAFRTPTLRSVSRSAPYFHDGSADTLEAAVRLMAGGGLPPGAPAPAADAPRPEPESVDPLFRKIDLTDEEVAQIVAFLQALDPIN
jgi:cytochrome c peroxidase